MENCRQNGNDGDSDIADSGYTWIEEYVNEWTQPHKPTNPSITVETTATAGTDKTVEKTGNKGFWFIANENESVEYKMQAKAAEGTKIVKTELYDGSELIASYNGDSIDEKEEFKAGVHYFTSKAYNDKGEKTTSDTSIVYVTGANSEPISEIGETAYPSESVKWTSGEKTYIAVAEE